MADLSTILRLGGNIVSHIHIFDKSGCIGKNKLKRIFDPKIQNNSHTLMLDNNLYMLIKRIYYIYKYDTNGGPEYCKDIVGGKNGHANMFDFTDMFTDYLYKTGLHRKLMEYPMTIFSPEFIEYIYSRKPLMFNDMITSFLINEVNVLKAYDMIKILNLEYDKNKITTLFIKQSLGKYTLDDLISTSYEKILKILLDILIDIFAKLTYKHYNFEFEIVTAYVRMSHILDAIFDMLLNEKYISLSMLDPEHITLLLKCIVEVKSLNLTGVRKTPVNDIKFILLFNEYNILKKYYDDYMIDYPNYTKTLLLELSGHINEKSVICNTYICGYLNYVAKSEVRDYEKINYVRHVMKLCNKKNDKFEEFIRNIIDNEP